MASGFGLAWSAWGDLPATAFSLGVGTDCWDWRPVCLARQLPLDGDHLDPGLRPPARGPAPSAAPDARSGVPPSPDAVSPLGSYPALRLRRLRQADWIRRLVRESELTPDDLIWSMVVHDGEGRDPGGLHARRRAPVGRRGAPRPPCGRATWASPPSPSSPTSTARRRTPRGSAATDPDGLVCRAVQRHEGRRARGRDHVRRGARPLHRPRPRRPARGRPHRQRPDHRAAGGAGPGPGRGRLRHPGARRT